MAFSTFDDSTDVISVLNDKPNDVDGMSASDLKAAFDQVGTSLKDYINNTLIPELEENSADNIIIPAGTQFSEDMTLNEALIYIISQVKQSVVTALPDRSVTEAKLAEDCVTAYEIKDGEVGTDEIADSAITTDKIADSSVTDDKIVTVSSSKIDGTLAFDTITGSIPTTRLSGTITNDQLEGSIANDKLAGEITHAKLASDAVYKAATATLATGNTEWVVTNSDVTASNHIIVSPADDTSWTEWVNKGIRLASQVEGNLVFHSRSATTAQVTVNILIIL